MKAFDMCKQFDRFGPFPALELPLCASCKDGNDSFPVIGFEVVRIVDNMILLLLVLHHQACWLGLAFIADLQAVNIAVMEEREREKVDQRLSVSTPSAIDANIECPILVPHPNPVVAI